MGCSPEINHPNCHVVGRIPLEEVSNYYKNAQIFCLPTRVEPFGLVFLEAFSHRLPVVAIEIGALTDIVSNGENGYLVAPDDIQQLGGRLVELLINPQKCKSFGENGYIAIKDKYTWANTGRLISEHIKKKLEEITPEVAG